jgi:endonuclease/exonuclease/phosphatase family metal-dependent hydrolase
LQEVFRLGGNVSFSPLVQFYNNVVNGIKSGPSEKDNNTMVEEFLNDASISFPHIAESRAPSTFCQDSGLLILSKHKIVKSEFVPFGRNSTWSDYVCDKGVLYAQIEMSEGCIAHFITTHLDAHSAEIRQDQVVQIGKHVTKWIHDREFELGKSFNELMIICGNFNIDSRTYNAHYTEMMKVFENLSFADIFAYYNETGIHPCTSGNTAAVDHILVHTKALEGDSSVRVVYKNVEKRRIDYAIESFTMNEPVKMEISDHNGISLKLRT